MVPATRMQKGAILSHIMGVANFSNGEKEYVLSKVNEPSELILYCRYECLEKVLDNETKINTIKLLLLREIAAMLEYYFQKDGNYEGILQVKEENWLNYVATSNINKKREQMAPERVQSTPHQTVLSNAFNKLRLLDFPTFNGKMANWPTFHTEFTSAAKIYNLGEILLQVEDHQT